MPALTTHHVGITVTDLDRMVDFYTDVLGLDVASRFEVGGESFATAVAVEGASAELAHLDGDGCLVELCAYEPEGETHGEASINQPGAGHLGFEVDDVDATVASLPASIETLGEPRTTPTGSRIAFFRDPEGNLIELLNPDAE